MNKKVLIILAEGFEEIEAVTPIDVLRRAGCEITVAGLNSKTVTGVHGIKIEADVLLNAYTEDTDAIVLPGGMPGAKNLSESPKVLDWIKKLNGQKKIVGAICAAPALVLQAAGILNGKKATCYPGFEKYFDSKTQFSEARIVKDGNIVTSRGPGTALEFSIQLVEELVGKEKARQLQEGMLLKESVVV